MSSSAIAVRRARTVVVYSMSTSTRRLGMFNGGVWVLPADVDDAQLGATIREALQVAREREGIEAPPLSRDMPDLLAPVYAAAGVKTAGTFVKNARAVAFDIEGDGLTTHALLPDRGGFTYGINTGHGIAADSSDAALAAECRRQWHRTDAEPLDEGGPSHT